MALMTRREVGKRQGAAKSPASVLVAFRLPKETHDRISDIVAGLGAGANVSAWIREAVERRLERGE